MTQRYRNSTGKSGFSWWAALALLLVFNPPLGIVALIGWGIYHLIRLLLTQSPAPRQPAHPANRYTTRRTQAFDDCPTGWFCFHSDKAEHHVRQGREIDPWDRPDIDIRKYQRR